MTYAYVPKEPHVWTCAETPAGEGDAGAGFGVLTDNYLYVSYLELPTCLGL